MIGTRRQSRSAHWSQNRGRVQRPAATGARPAVREESVVEAPVAQATPAAAAASHALVKAQDNARLREYEARVKTSFDAIVPTLKNIAAMQYDSDFETRAQEIALERFGFELPKDIIADAWVDQLDMRRLFAWAVFETYQRFCDDFFAKNHLISDEQFQSFLMDCGFHTLDVSPCADGRLAHVISYVLRLPYREVRRKSYAGAMFDVQDSIDKWTETELIRFREGRPNTSDQPTRYLKTVVYHFSSGNPEFEGCAAHGSDTMKAAEAGLGRLKAFQEAVENTYCCGASIDLLLMGLDTDTDAIRVHVPDQEGNFDLFKFLDAGTLYDRTASMNAQQAQAAINDQISMLSPTVASGMQRFIARLVENNFSQIEYVRVFHNGEYRDIGHAERFIGMGMGFEEIQLRNLTYFAYMNTVEEAAADLDVGVKIFTGLNVAHGLPVPVVIRFDYHGNVPGARDRAVANCKRVVAALQARYAQQTENGLLHTLLAVRDCVAGGQIEVLESSVYPKSTAGAH